MFTSLTGVLFVWTGIGKIIERNLSLLVSFSAGSFLVVVLHDLIPDSVRHSHQNKNYIKHLAWFILGILVMLLAGLLFGH